MKNKKCFICKEEFLPSRPLQKVCGFLCGITLSKKLREKKELEKKRFQSKDLKERKEKLKTKQNYEQDLQRLVNKYVKMRDFGQPCISCRKIIKKVDAGHFFSVGQYPSVRFELDNIHAQCVNCNQFKGGNIHEYKKNLVYKIGKERLEKLEILANKKSLRTISDVKEMIVEYKEKIKNYVNI
jgi:hypothetical protein